jgi:hypothetical protein
MTVLIDSDILIEVSRGRNRAVISRWMELGAATLERRPSRYKFNQLRPFGLWLSIA